MKVLDTFAGAGGFSLGFEMSGLFEIVGAIEEDLWACETFKFNHPNAIVINNDIRNIDENILLKNFKNVDVVLGGPPCQGYSIANNKSLDPKDPRNSLFKEFIRIGKILSPNFMIMENVPNLLKAKTSNNELVIDIIKIELEQLGYYFYSRILNASDYGVPQNRKRLIIIASKKPLQNPFPEPTHFFCENQNNLFSKVLEKTPTLWEAISDLPEIDAREGSDMMEYSANANNDYQILMRQKSSLVHNHIAMKHSKRMIERFESMSWGQSSSDVPDHLKPYKRNSAGVISESTYDQNNRRLYPHKLCHTITASFYANFVHPFKHRNFTPREGARIQSFPDNFVFKGKPTVVSQKLLAKENRNDEKHLGQYNQIGNAVPPLMAKAIANNLINNL